MITVLSPIESAMAAEPPRLIFRQPPKPLAANAVSSDWPRFLGPAHNATSPETELLKDWTDGGPHRVWEIAKGNGHSCPAIAGDRLVLFHRTEGDQERVECLHAVTGKEIWAFEYSAPYADRFGGGDGPRTSPVINGDHVFAFGIGGLLHCFDLLTGAVLWRRDIATDYSMAPNFFGHGSTPLARGDRLILSIGGKDNASVLALNAATGQELWIARHPWGASYASPIPAHLHGRDCVLVFAGGESRPPSGGLLGIDAATGEILSASSHRPLIAESVSAASPVVVGDRVFITESYGAGGAMMEIRADFTARRAWSTEKFGVYFMTPVAKASYLYGFHGQQPRLAELVCFKINSGDEVWRNDLDGKFQRGSLLAVDGWFLCLGENGALAWLDLSPQGPAVKQQAQPFAAPETWTLPALSRGLLYVCQNARSADGQSSRLICYDLRDASE